MNYVDKLYTINVTGLKPLTKHDFYFETVKRNTDCRPINGDIGDDLVTNIEGSLSFEFHYSSQTEAAWIAASGGYANWIKLHGYSGVITTNILNMNLLKLIEVKALNSYAMCRIQTKYVNPVTNPGGEENQLSN